MKQAVPAQRELMNTRPNDGLEGRVRMHSMQRQIDGSPRQLAQQEKLSQWQHTSSTHGQNGLPLQLRAGIEALSGMDMGNVRVHRNSSKPAQLNALAYAQGNDIHLGPAQERHLPHEAWHVVQQRQGRVRPTMQLKAGVDINADPALEHEADVMGAQALDAGQQSQYRPAAVLASNPPATIAGKVIQGEFAVQVSLDEFDIDEPVSGVNADAVVTSHKELRISSVHIADRPAGLFSPQEKSHTTAWAVYADQVRNAVLGRPLAAAVTAIGDLYTDAKNLPGVARAGYLVGKAKETYDAAKKRMDTLVAINLLGLPEERHIDLIQRLAKGFLAYRNVIPLSQVDIGRATGHGEPKVLDSLRPLNAMAAGWEEDPDLNDGSLRLKEGQASKARAEMWSLMDSGAIASFFNLQATAASAPGIAEDDGGAAVRIADLITQHLWTLENAYETLFRAIEMDGEPSIRSYLTFVGCRGLYQDLIYDKIKSHYDGAQEKSAKENDDRYMTAGPAGQGLFSAQVVTSKDGRVTGLNIGSRAPTALGSDQGSHATAWVVYVDAVRNVVIGKPFGEALTGVLHLCEEAKKLPGMQRLKHFDEKQRYWYALAIQELERAFAAAKSTTAKIAFVPALQRMIKAYLGFRNVIPLSEIKGGLADGNAEAYSRAKIRYLESGFTNWTGVGGAPAKDPAIYREAFWELYDYKAVYKAALHQVEPADAPGIGEKEDMVPILGDSIKQHLIAMHAAYPNAFAKLNANSPEFINYVLEKLALRDEYHVPVIARSLSK
ncbi:MAG: eCIS core domain-containing protein [Dyella sp.]|uniref:eCIS core domain-containing protein n=1 Tax=Dyella sp. TaxID=1869338 RepID=UPI003F7E1BD3